MGGLFGSLASGLRRRELKATDAGNLSWAALFGQQNSRAGVSVNVDSALKVSTVFACLRVLADGIAQVPLKVYREKADGSKELAKDHPTYRLLSRRPNEWMTSFEFRQVMMFHAVLLGNGCAYIGRIRGVPRELIPLVPALSRKAERALLRCRPDHVRVRLADHSNGRMGFWGIWA